LARGGGAPFEIRDGLFGGARVPDQVFLRPVKKPPYLVSVVSFDRRALEWGRRANREACALFARSLAENDWPGYREPGQNHERAFRVSLPPWAINQLQDREEAGEFAAALAEAGSMLESDRFLTGNS
jgi:hypothetical protein